TSSLMAFLAGDIGTDVDSVEDALKAQVIVLPPVVLTEIISDPKLAEQVTKTLLGLPMLEILPGYWERAGKTRAKILARNLKARVADALIAQSCLDYNIALISRDRDFRHFEKFAQLKVVW
ncbi:MAG: PIN domain-containing protein, partial [Thermodesulfobacteriota bacterium]